MELSLITLLRVNVDVFAWTTKDLVGIDPKVMVHRLQVNPQVRPTWQKKRPRNVSMNEVIKVEVQRLLEAGHISELRYSDWVCNVVLVEKSTGK